MSGRMCAHYDRALVQVVGKVRGAAMLELCAGVALHALVRTLARTHAHAEAHPYMSHRLLLRRDGSSRYLLRYDGVAGRIWCARHEPPIQCRPAVLRAYSSNGRAAGGSAGRLGRSRVDPLHFQGL